MSSVTHVAPPVPSEAHTSHRALSRILTVVWMAIMLGIALQVAILITKTAVGAPWPGMKWLPDLLNGVTWAVFVCAGVVLGTLAGRARSAVMGVLGLISAPLAFSLAKGLQRGVQSAMDAPVDKITPALYMICGVKAVEYAALGAAIGWLLSRTWARAIHFALAGAVAGVTFGAVSVWITASIAKAKFPAIVGSALNELIFPIGCALVIYLATYAGRHLAMLNPHHGASAEPSADAGVPLS